MKKRLIQQLQILMRQHNMIEHKEAFYASYGVTSSTKMTEEQLRDAIVRLGGKPTQGREKVNADVRYLRSQVLKVMTTPAPKGLNIPNEWDILNPFIERHGGKRLSAMNDTELNALKKKLYAMRQSGWNYKTVTATPKPVVVMVDMNSISNNSYNA